MKKEGISNLATEFSQKELKQKIKLIEKIKEE